MNQRQRILEGIRDALGRGPLPETTQAALRRRLQYPRLNVVPGRGRVDGEERLALFVAEAERVQTTVERVGSVNEIPGRVLAYLQAANLPAVVRAARDPLVRSVPWDEAPLLTIEEGPAVNGDTASITPAVAGIAETGSVMIASAADNPTTLAFLPEAHLVALPARRIHGTYEDAWASLRAKRAPGRMPRVVTWITGPSRTADIEQTLLLGAHGPRRLHVLILDD